MGGSAALITYNVFANGKWVNFMRLHPYTYLAALAFYGAYNNSSFSKSGKPHYFEIIWIIKIKLMKFN